MSIGKLIKFTPQKAGKGSGLRNWEESVYAVCGLPEGDSGTIVRNNSYWSFTWKRGKKVVLAKHEFKSSDSALASFQKERDTRQELKTFTFDHVKIQLWSEDAKFFYRVTNAKTCESREGSASPCGASRQDAAELAARGQARDIAKSLGVTITEADLVDEVKE